MCVGCVAPGFAPNPTTHISGEPVQVPGVLAHQSLPPVSVAELAWDSQNSGFQRLNL
jgi:hypothetical protein